MNQRNNRDNKQIFEKYIVQATNKRKLSIGGKINFYRDTYVIHSRLHSTNKLLIKF